MDKVVNLYDLHSIVQKGDRKFFVASVEPVNLQKLEDVCIRDIKTHGLEGEYLAWKIDMGSNMMEIKSAIEALDLEYRQ